MRLTLPVAFGLILLVLTVGLLPIVDPDFFWHLKIGEVIRQTGAIPSTEIFSHTAHGQPWVIQGWLADVVLDYVWESTGVTGIRLLVAGLFLCTWVVIYRTVRLYVIRPETALLLSGIGVALLLPGLAPRPTMATALALAITLYSLLAFRRSGELRWLLILPPVFALWPNLHFGYITGLGLIALFVLSELLARAAPIAPEHHELGTLLARGPFVIGLLCMAAIGANPLGYGVVSETVQMFFTNSVARVSEWQSPSFENVSGKLVYVAIGIFIFARSLARRSIHWLDIVVPLAVIGAALSAVRHIPLMGLVLTSFIARAVANWEPGVVCAGRRYGSGSGVATTREVSRRAAAFINFALVLCVVVVTMVLSPLADKKFAGMRNLWQPSGAADFLAGHELKGRLFNTYAGGGYLISRLYPRQLVFIDGRYNPYPKKVIDDYLSIVDGMPGWFDHLQSYGIDIVLAETDSAFRQLMMLRIEFRLVYRDQYYSVFVRDIDRFRGLPTVRPSIVPTPPG